MPGSTSLEDRDPHTNRRVVSNGEPHQHPEGKTLWPDPVRPQRGEHREEHCVLG